MNFRNSEVSTLSLGRNILPGNLLSHSLTDTFTYFYARRRKAEDSELQGNNNSPNIIPPSLFVNVILILLSFPMVLIPPQFRRIYNLPGPKRISYNASLYKSRTSLAGDSQTRADFQNIRQSTPAFIFSLTASALPRRPDDLHVTALPFVQDRFRSRRSISGRLRGPTCHRR
ncbi:hypothetical protein L798_05111 [Zootermopsis nevadensis]|uniref:Uncharacterized protein n=1 Tax=Zootermopsis nevadensis TaxID=136037 RepID=A0A067RHR7_ZOONE|nr:hypothetical protein L798_05111 [Zootermopsis nevadensis]